jgi:hypothetical protein
MGKEKPKIWEGSELIYWVFELKTRNRVKLSFAKAEEEDASLDLAKYTGNKMKINFTKSLL